MQRHPLIRTIYLYIFALLGLVLITIGTVNFVQMGLKTYVFTKAEQDRALYDKRPVAMPIAPEKIAKIDENGEPIEAKQTVELTESEQKAINNWIEDYNEWKEKSEKIDSVIAKRHEDAANNLALILIGLPLYLYHWRIIKKETKDKNA